VLELLYGKETKRPANFYVEIISMTTERRLNIGGIEKKKSWEIFNINTSDNTDHVGDAKDLSRFKNNSFIEIYASHVLEHIDYIDELKSTLCEWYRVLKPKGRIYISVPDLDTLCLLLTQKNNLSTEDEFDLMRMVYGGHIDSHDYHLVGFTQNILAEYLHISGFKNITKVDSHKLFDDTSEKEFKGTKISLNITATKD